MSKEIYHGSSELVQRFNELKKLKFYVKDEHAYFWHNPPAFDDNDDDDDYDSEKEYLKYINNQNFNDSNFDCWRWQCYQECQLDDGGGALFNMYFVRVTLNELFETATCDDTEVSFTPEIVFMINLKWTHADNGVDHFELISIKENPKVKL